MLGREVRSVQPTLLEPTAQIRHQPKLSLDRPIRVARAASSSRNPTACTSSGPRTRTLFDLSMASSSQSLKGQPSTKHPDYADRFRVGAPAGLLTRSPPTSQSA